MRYKPELMLSGPHLAAYRHWTGLLAMEALAVALFGWLP